MPQDDSRPPFFSERERHFVDGIDVLRADDGFGIDIAEERDLVLHVRRKKTLGAAEQDIRLDADGAQFSHAVLGGLSLGFLAALYLGDQGHMDENTVLTRPLHASPAGSPHRKGQGLSMSPTVPPISQITTSTSPESFLMAALISVVTCGITCTVLPR